VIILATDNYFILAIKLLTIIISFYLPI